MSGPSLPPERPAAAVPPASFAMPPIRTGFLIPALAAGALVVPVSAPVVSALSGEPLAGVGLHHPPSYLALAPLWGVLDFLTLRTVAEHQVILGSLVALFLAWRLVRRRRPAGLASRVAVEVGVAVLFLAGVLALYLVGILASRPMVALRVDDPDLVVVDFHSHTRASHDGRPGFTAERVRAWHRGAGFHLAWITDHDSIGAARRATARNPERAGDGVSLLAGREVVYADQHVVALGTVDPREGLPPGGSLAERCARWPVLIQTIPNDLSRVHPGPCTEEGAGVRAIELVDGDPRGLAQGERERAWILQLADSLGLVPVSASNLHGWGRTAASWNVVRVPGWRDLPPGEVGRRVERVLRDGARDALEVVVVRRPVPAPKDGAGAAAASLVSLADFAARRTRPERLSWIVWLALALALRRRMARGDASV